MTTLTKSQYVEMLKKEQEYKLLKQLRQDFPALVIYCEHVKKMLEAIRCPPTERHRYEPLCWWCRKAGNKDEQ